MITLTELAAQLKKSYQQRGATEGPGVDPEALSRGGARGRVPGGRATPDLPLPPAAAGVQIPVELSPQPMVGGYPGPVEQGLAAHEAMTMMRPPLPGGEAC
jgi:hypothetical protein